VRACRLSAIVFTILFATAVPFLAAPDEAQAASAKARLKATRQDLAAARAELAELRVKIRAAVAADDQVGFKQLARRYHQVKRRITTLRRRARRLALAVAPPMTPGRDGSWSRVIKAAAAKHHISATSLRRMMMLESGGRADLVCGPFHGLFQYCSGTWNGSWNRYRKYGIRHGGAQIWATAYAIKRGWGPSMWPVAYRMAFGG
jgi:hypothetical protein